LTPRTVDATPSFIMMTVVINLHHFIVDGFIWRTKPVPPRPVSTPPQGQVPVAVERKGKIDDRR